MRKSKLLLIGIIAALFGGTMTVNAEEVTDDFTGYETTTSGTTLGDNWVIIGNDGSWAAFGSSRDYVHYNEYGEHYVAGNSNSNYSKGVWLVLKQRVTGTVTFTATNGNGSNTFTIYASKADKSGDTYATVGTPQSYSIAARTSTAKTFTFDAGSTPTYVAFCLVGTSKNPKLLSVTYNLPEAVAGPSLLVSGHNEGLLDFGMVEAGAKKSLTLSNPGGADITVAITTTGGFTADASKTIAAGGEETLEITAPAATATGTVTITPSPAVEGIDPVTINLSCIVKDPSKQFIDFADNALPEDWEMTTSDYYSWSFEEGVAGYPGVSDGTLTTPAMIFEDGEPLVFDARGNSSSFMGSVTIQTSVNGQTFTNLKTFENIRNGEWEQCIANIPAGTKYVRFAVSRADIDNIYGGQLDATPLPKMTVEGATNGALNWGYTPVSAGSTKTIVVKNTGKADLEVSFTVTKDYTLNAAQATVKAGESFDLVVGTPNHDVTSDDPGVLTITPAEGSGLSPVTITLTSYYKEPEAVMSLDKTSIAFGKVYADKSETVTVSNTGDAELVAAISIESTTEGRFEVSTESVTVPAGESKTFDVTYKYDPTLSGNFTATIKVTPEAKSATSIQVSANNKKAGVWSEDFSDGKIPVSWTNDGWVIGRHYSDASTEMRASSQGSNGFLITPRLKAEANEELSFDFISQGAELLVEWASDINATEWTSVGTYEESQTITFTAPAAGVYYLRFSGSGSYLDNFEGFNLDLLENDAYITASTLPASGKQYEDYKASVTVQNRGSKAQTIVARLLINGAEKLVKEAELDIDGQAVIDLTIKPEEAVEEGTAKIEVTLKGVADFAALTVEQTITIESLQLVEVKDAYEDETENSFSVLTYKVNFQLDRQFNAGWNTVVLPFDYSDVEEVFGEGAKLYTFNGVSEAGSLSFVTVDAITGGTPYVLYLPAAISEPLLFKAVSYTVAGVTAASRGASSAKFVPTYNPVAAETLTGKYGVTADGSIMKAGATATMNGFRAYFDVTIAEGESRPAPGLIDENVDPSRVITIDLAAQTTGISTVQTAASGNAVYNMQGQRVANAVKGLYIVNGKKMVRK